MANIITQLKNTAKDFIGNLLYEEWDKSFNEFATKYKTLGEIPGFQQYVKNRPDLANQSTASWKSFFAGLAKGESSFRPKAKHGSYKGLYQIGNLDENRLSDYEYQHTEAFKHLGKNALSFLTKDDLALAHGKGYSQSDVLKMAWQQGRRVLNYLYNGDNPKDGNEKSKVRTDLATYVQKTSWDNSSVNIYSSLPDAIRDSNWTVGKNEMFFNVQDKIRIFGRDFAKAGRDLYKGLRDNKGEIDSLSIKRLRGDKNYYYRPGDTYNFENRILTKPMSEEPYHLNKPLTAPQNQTEWETMMKDIDSIKINIMPNIMPNTKRFGGKLRYGWGGIKDYWDYAQPYLGTSDHGSYSNRNGRLAYEKHTNFANLFSSDYVSRSANEVISDKDWDPEKSYVYIQGQGYIPYAQLTDAQKNATGVHQGIYTITDDSMISALQAKDQSIYAEMQNKINQDIIRNQQLVTNVARFGGMLGVRRKYPYGGTYIPQSPYSGYIGWGTEVKPEDISYTDYNAKGEGIVGNQIATYSTSGLGLGATIGGLIGTIVPGIGNILGAVIGASVGAAGGAGIGAGIGIKYRNDEETRRRELIAEQKEQNRQNTINNMNNRYENDVAKIRNAKQQTTFSGQSFYMKHGGMIKPRMKYNNGGTILPNSSDTAVAYGRTHEQVDPMTGETGITYGNAEVEGGGLVGNKELPGEVIQQTPNGDRIYSDSLYVPGTRATYAQIAKALTDKKGVIEQEISKLQETLDTSLDTFNRAKLAKAKTGTATRNIEKLAAKLNLKTGELAQVDAQLNNVFASQEQMATSLGLRDIAPVTARFGGYRPKYKFGIPELGLTTNGLSFIGNMLATGLSSKSNLAQLDFVSGLSVPKTNKVEAEYYTVDTSPYEEASRKMAAETKRFNKWIEDNISNPQVLRNQKRKNLINYYEGLSDINAKKSAYLSSRYDLSRNARIAAINVNNQGEYQDAINRYNKSMQIANARMSVNNQTTQNYMASINQLMKAFGSYAMQNIYLAQLPEGVRNEFYFGRKG